MMLRANAIVMRKYASPADANLSSKGRDMVTYILVSVLAHVGAGVASVMELKRMAGEQNINTDLANQLGEQFKKEKGLEKVKMKYMNGPDSIGPHFNPYENKPHGRIGGPSAEATRKALKRNELSGRMLSLDSPEIRLHELGHARSHAKKNWSAKLYAFGPVLGSLGSAIAGHLKAPGIALLISVIGQSPRLLEEWRASAYAKKVLKENLPEEEAKRAFGVLNRAFRTYLYGAAASMASDAAYAYMASNDAKRKGS